MAQASAERILGLIAEVPAIKDSPLTSFVVGARRRRGSPARDGAAEDGRPAFERVGFAYPGGERVLADFDLELRPGETVALVGPTGGGKSTIAALACRFYEPTEGRI